ncbi:DUF5686 and carboxypeptidase-like regulatory domain-containing protein [soil metagenome]
MNRISRFIFFLVIFFLPAISFAQLVAISGTVQDAHTKEPVGFASVYMAVAQNGMTTDSAGRFTIHYDPSSRDSLIVTFVGYQRFYIPASKIDASKPIVVDMQRGGNNNEVVIRTKINKGLFLWKKIMSKKKAYNRYNLSNFGYESYNKLEVDLKNFNADKARKNFILKSFSFVFDNIDSTSEKDPFLPAYLIESLSDYAFQKNPKRFREEIRASHTKGFKNESISRLLGVMNQNVNIYSNYVNVMDKDFISPFNDNGDSYYSFNVPDTQVLNGVKVFHFTFRPKRPGQNTFQGDAWVISKTYQIEKITLYIGHEANINFIDRLSIFQEFHALNDSVYFLTRDKFFADFRTLGKHSLTLIGRKTTSYQDISINSDSITAVFKDQKIEELVRTDTGVANHSDSAWNLLRHDTLSANEKAIYVTIDKLLDMPKFKRLERTLKFLATGYKDIGNVEIGPWFNWVSSNKWEGTRFRFDLGTNTGFNKQLYLHGYLAYGLKDKKFKGQTEAYWILKRTPKLTRLHVSYINDIDNGISQYGEVSQDNIFSIAIRKPNTTRKFVSAQQINFDAIHEWGKGFSTELFVAHRKFDPLLNLLPKDSFPVINGEALTSFEVALKLRFAYLEQFFEGDYFRYSLGTKYPIVELMITKGIPNVFKSAYDYTKLTASIKDKMKISPLGTLSYKIYAGQVFGTLPFAFLEVHPGNDLYYYSKSSFNLMNRFEYLSDKYAGINIEHNIGSGLFRFTPLTRKLKWRQFWNIKTVWGSISNENRLLNDRIIDDSTKVHAFRYLNGGNYTEIGTGIDNIFRVFRLDFVWRFNPASSLPRSSRFGIFGSFQFQF